MQQSSGTARTKNKPREKEKHFSRELFPPTVGKSDRVHAAGPGADIMEPMRLATPALCTLMLLFWKFGLSNVCRLTCNFHTDLADQCDFRKCRTTA